jgi:hypothetical protein
MRIYFRYRGARALFLWRFLSMPLVEALAANQLGMYQSETNHLTFVGLHGLHTTWLRVD